MQKERVALTTIADGSATVYSLPFSGELSGIYFEIGTLAAGAVDMTITAGSEDASILAVTNIAGSGWYYPTIGKCDTSGAARLFAAAGTAVPGDIPVEGSFKIVLAQGGDKKTGHVTFYVED